MTGAVEIGFGTKDRELFTAHPSEDIVATEPLADLSCRFFEDGIAGEMAELIVDLFEMIEIE